tara:strand:+ start:4574 stop:4735 length:162 start_codon:yes stop_codon:yes gene_type:complete
MSDLENNDLLFLLKRLKHLIKLEEYEKCITISKWIEDIKEKIEQNKDEKDIKR